MTGVREPPKKEQPSRLVGRLVTLTLLVAIAGVVIWGVVTEQRLTTIESVSHSSLEIESPVEVGGLTLNVVEHRGGPIPVVFLHDVDLAGGAVFDGAVQALPARFRGVVIDLPGFGMSQRVPEVSDTYTVAGMAEVVADVMSQRLQISAVLVGVGYGGQVAAEIAVSYPDLVRGLVMVDVDFWPEQTWEEVGKGLPFLGRPLTFALEGGGLLGEERWAPNCDAGGWCPSPDQTAVRELAVTIRGSTDSIIALRETLPSSLVPASLPEVSAPSAYVWSQKGSVTQETIDRLVAALPELVVIKAVDWMAHVDTPTTLSDAIEAVSP